MGSRLPVHIAGSLNWRRLACLSIFLLVMPFLAKLSYGASSSLQRVYRGIGDFRFVRVS
jgi:hypothetical protein